MKSELSGTQGDSLAALSVAVPLPSPCRPTAFASGPAEGAAQSARLIRLIDPSASHPGAGACYIDHAVPENVLCALENLFRRLPLAERNKCSQGLNDRSYYADAEGWVVDALRAAVVAVSKGSHEGAAGAGGGMLRRGYRRGARGRPPG